LHVIHLADLVVQQLKPTDSQVTYYDEDMPAFGVRVGRRRKTFVVALGKDRKRVKLGNYPAQSRQDARQEAGRFIYATDPSAAHLISQLEARPLPSHHLVRSALPCERVRSLHSTSDVHFSSQTNRLTPVPR